MIPCVIFKNVICTEEVLCRSCTKEDPVIDSEMKKRIDRDFQYHKPVDGQVPMYTAIRAKAKELALLIAELCPRTREQSLALTHVEAAVMNANAAIARNAWVAPVEGVDSGD